MPSQPDAIWRARRRPQRDLSGRSALASTGGGGDDPNLSYDQVPPDLQWLRGPSESLAGGLAAFHGHAGLADAAPADEAMT